VCPVETAKIGISGEFEIHAIEILEQDIEV
jgi:hypothetical protein